MRLALNHNAPLGLALVILALILFGSFVAAASATEVKMPTFTTKVATPPTVFMPPAKGANSVVAFGGNCMDGETSTVYAETLNLMPIMVGKFPGTTNTFGIFAGPNKKMHIMVMTADQKNVCEITSLENIVVFDETGKAVGVE